MLRFVGRLASNGTERSEVDVLVSVERFHRARIAQYASGPNNAFKSGLHRKIRRELIPAGE